ncbi:hypothetical protein V5O48_017626 [Marasmius crinis-equi]|uniref:DUF659 domain-containing protein n=1 Tax=Marasmius crinis-equi TaxID=585013 RepID=A0ABR3ENF9_9AGAR
MPPPEGPLWKFFIKGGKQNTAHAIAYCRACIEKRRPSGTAIELDDEGKPILSTQSWVVEAMGANAGRACGKRSSMIAHILGKSGRGACPNASSEARKEARRLKGGNETSKRARDDDSDEEEEDGSQPAAKKDKTGVTYQHTGKNEADSPPDPEVIKLFLMFRARAIDAMPSRQQIGGKLLDEAHGKVVEKLKGLLKGKYATLGSDGWKDESRDSVKGVNVTCEHKAYTTDLILATGHKKDGASMCIAFEEMIEDQEDEYGLVVVAVCSDNDGGTARGRKDLIVKWPWLFGIPCLAHQFQLILGDYFKENPAAAETAEQATALIGWLLNHQLVRTVFNEVQAATSNPPGVVLAFLMACITRWNTHLVAFDRLLVLQQSMRQAALTRRDDIIAAQVGAESNAKKKAKLREDAISQIDLIDDVGFWKQLKAVVDDIEPICLGVNINQTDSMCLDQAVLTLAGIFLHFRKHPERAVAQGMVKRIELRWKALDQPLFLFAVIMNPFEKLTRFGDKANILPFTLNDVALQLFRRVNSQPPKVPRSEDAEREFQVNLKERESKLSNAFLHYLSGSGPFQDWENSRENFERVKEKDPIAMWTQYLKMADVRDLADLSILVLSISGTQAGMERTFSDLKIKKTRLRNRMKLPGLKKRTMIGADLRDVQKEDGYIKERGKRHNHDSDKELLPVLQVDMSVNSDINDDDSNESTQRILIRSRQGWREEMVRWIKEEQERDSGDEAEEEARNVAYGGQRRLKWLPQSLELLFGDAPQPELDDHARVLRRRTAYTEEARQLELLAQEEEDPILDDGAIEGSDDDYS